jgi:hypothetical protein
LLLLHSLFHSLNEIINCRTGPGRQRFAVALDSDRATRRADYLTAGFSSAFAWLGHLLPPRNRLDRAVLGRSRRDRRRRRDRNGRLHGDRLHSRRWLYGSRYGRSRSSLRLSLGLLDLRLGRLVIVVVLTALLLAAAVLVIVLILRGVLLLVVVIVVLRGLVLIRFLIVVTITADV